MLDNTIKIFGVKKVDFVWLNIEGAEVKALKGMKTTLRENNCKLCISTHKLKNGKVTTKKVMKILNRYSYMSMLRR
jgi:hypothetical protein